MIGLLRPTQRRADMASCPAVRTALLRLHSLPRGARIALLFAGAAAVALAVLAQAPIVQPHDHYVFPDQRAFLGVPHALNVLSNLPFALVGVLGWLRVASLEPRLRFAARVAFLAIAFATAGSSLYHLAPGPERLLVDRLPIALAFAGLTAWVLGDRLGSHWTPGALDARAFGLALLVYLLGKVCELFDRPLYELGGIVSGHTLKHLLSAAACACLVPAALARRARS